MLSHAKEHESLTGKLLLSSALVVVTVGFGYWQYGQAASERAAMMAQMQAQMMAAAQAAQAAQPQAQAAAPAPAAPDATANAAVAADNAPAASSAPSNQMAMASPQAPAQSTAPAAPAKAPAQNLGQNTGPTALLPADAPKALPPPTLTGMDAIRAFLPTEGISPPLPTVTGTPPDSVNPVMPAGGHLVDGDYTSDKIGFEWGDLRARIVVTSGKINAVQIVSYPDHRSQSLYLIQLADPILTTEVIKNQMAKVNTVSSATNSSIAFQDAIANAMMKATR